MFHVAISTLADLRGAEDMQQARRVIEVEDITNLIVARIEDANDRSGCLVTAANLFGFIADA